MVLILKTKLVVYLFIKIFIAITVRKKVIILSVVLSQLLVVLNAKPIAKLLMSYKKPFANILENKA